MNTSSKSVRVTYLSILLIITVFTLALVPVIAFTYSYDTVSVVASSVGFLILLASSGFLWSYSGRWSRQVNSTDSQHAITLGTCLGLLWIAEISINNFITPPLPARDIIDDIFWASIALTIFVLAVICSYRTERIRVGIEVGTWSGFVSGTIACWMALSLVVFGMRFIIQDPLNVAEWAAHEKENKAPTIAAYFAFETFAGAFLHLIVLGILMGGLLGGLGGIIGKTIRTANRRILQS